MYTRILLLISILLFLLSCEKSKTLIVNSNTPYTSTLKVTVLKNYFNSGNQPADSALSHTFVYVYNSDYDRSNNNSASYTGVTDSTGLVVFSGLTQTKYYLRISNAQFGIKDDNVNTPLNGIALDKVDY